MTVGNGSVAVELPAWAVPRGMSSCRTTAVAKVGSNVLSDLLLVSFVCLVFWMCIVDEGVSVHGRACRLIASCRRFGALHSVLTFGT
jgi:hypothetical protein